MEYVAEWSANSEEFPCKDRRSTVEHPPTKAGQGTSATRGAWTNKTRSDRRDRPPPDRRTLGKQQANRKPAPSLSRELEHRGKDVEMLRESGSRASCFTTWRTLLSDRSGIRK